MSPRSRSCVLGSAVAAAFLLGACGGGGDGFVNPPPPPPAVVLTISPTSATVNVGSTTSLAVSISGGSPTPTLASCTSSSPSTASVTLSGVSCVVVGVSPGSASITATVSSGQTVAAAVTVAPLPAAITDFTLTPATASLAVGQTTALTATPTSPAGASVAVAYSSSSASVASVSVAGVVTAVSPGTASITATAVGGGVGFTPATITRTAVITVTANPCTPIPVTLPISQSGMVASGSCLINASAGGRGLVLDLNLSSASALELVMTPNNFAPFIAAFPRGETGGFITRSRNVAEPVSGIYHLPSGRTEIRVGALNGAGLGNFQLQVQQVSASVENCRAVVVGGSLTSNQALQEGDCLDNGFRADEFFLFSSRPCTITMSRTTSSNSMADPFLEVFDGTNRVAFDDDSGGDLNARLSFASCQSTSNAVLEVRATSQAAGDLGSYAFSVLFGTAPGQAGEGRVTDLAAPIHVPGPSGKALRAPSAPSRGTLPESGSWLRHLGIDVESAAR